MWDTVLDALIDSAKTLPFLLLIYLVIELLEHNRKAKNKAIKLLNGKFAPLVAGGVGLVPQCGFSVMATDLYCQNYLKLGTLIAFFVATSDEAMPILLTNSKTAGAVWIVIFVKIVYAVVLGYVINLLDKRTLSVDYELSEVKGCCNHGLENDDDKMENSHVHLHIDGKRLSAHDINESENCSQANIEHTHLKSFWHFVKHPLIHTAKIFIYIFVVNVVFGLLMYYAENSILAFAAKLGFVQCFFTAAIGLIPNCASSVILAGMYSKGIIGMSALLAGLVSSSGIALAVLFRQKKWKRSIGILGIMYTAGILLGVIMYFVF